MIINSLSPLRDAMIDSLQDSLFDVNGAEEDAVDLTPLIYDINIVIVAGQSLSKGYQAFPSLTKSCAANTLMYGESVTAKVDDVSTFIPRGSGQFNQLAGTNDMPAVESPVPDSSLSSLSPSVGVLGEKVNYAAVSMLAEAVYDKYGFDSDKYILTGCVGNSGSSIDQLSKDYAGTPYRYGVFETYLTQVKSLADAAGQSIGVIAIIWMQGESDRAASTTRYIYKSKLSQIKSDYTADAKSILGQTEDPIWLNYQTQAVWGNSLDKDSNGDSDLPVQMAQYEMSEEESGAYMVSNVYPVTDKGTHLTANGTRNVGCWFGRALVDILVNKVEFEPLKPVSITRSGTTISIEYNTNTISLDGEAYDKYSPAQNSTQKGFRITDGLSTNRIGIVSVSVASADTIEIEISSEPSGDAYVWYASGDGWGTVLKAGGLGWVNDGNEDVAPYNYEYKEGAGMEPESEIPELIGKPYDMRKWSPAFVLPEGYLA